MSGVEDENGRATEGDNKDAPNSQKNFHTIGPWRWMIMAGYFYVGLVLFSLATCFGVLFGDYLSTQKVSSTNNAWILNIHVFLWYFSSMFTAPICRQFSWKSVGLTFSVVIAVAFMVIAIFPSPWTIFFMFSLVVGPCGGIITIICMSSLPFYFPDRVGMTTSLFLGGTACGQIIMPLLSRLLQNHFGFSGATLILSAIFLNTCVSFALLRPLPKDKDIAIKQVKSEKESTETQEPFLESGDVNCSQQRKEKSSSTNVILIIVRDIVKGTSENMKGIRYPNLLIVSLSLSFMVAGFVNYVSLAPFAVVNAGYSKEVASLGLSATGAGNILTRLIMIFIADKKWLNKRNLYIAGVAGIVVFASLMPLVLKVEVLIFLCFLGLGMSVAVANSLFIVIMVDTVGIKLYESGLAVTTFFLAVLCVVIGPIIGFIRDYSLSYTLSLYCCAFIVALSGLVWVFMPCAQKRSKLNQEAL